MAKPFYSIEEVCQKLGKDQEAVKALVRDGSLREFRDAGKVFFKAEDVDKLAAGKKGDTGEVILESADSDELPSLSPASGGTSIIGLEPLEDEPKPGKKKGDTVISASGIKVFDDDLELDSDPMAKTQVSPSAGSDEVSLEGTGSGSGLMDLTREADDTSLGAELLDEIYPGEEEAAPPPKKPASKKAAAPEPEVIEEPSDAGEVIAPIFVATNDPAEGLMGGLLVGSVAVMAVAAVVVAGALQGFVPGFTSSIAGGPNTWYFVGGAVGAVAIASGVGWFVGKATSGPRRR